MENDLDLPTDIEGGVIMRKKWTRMRKYAVVDIVESFRKCGYLWPTKDGIHIDLREPPGYKYISLLVRPGSRLSVCLKRIRLMTNLHPRN